MTLFPTMTLFPAMKVVVLPAVRSVLRPAPLVLVAALAANGCAGKFMEQAPDPAFCDTSRVFAAVDGVVGTGALIWATQVDMDRMTNHFTFERLEDGSLGGGYDAAQLAAGIILGASFLVEAGRSYKAANRCRRMTELLGDPPVGPAPDTVGTTLLQDPFRRR